MRGERVTALAGAVLVALAAVTVSAVLVAQGARPMASEVASDEPAPADLMWVWFQECNSVVTHDGDFAIAIGLEQDAVGRFLIRIVDDQGQTPDEPELLAYQDRYNTCLAAQRFAPSNTVDEYWNPRAPAERLLMLEVYERWIAPCLVAHGFEPPAADIAAYLDPQQLPWADLYFAISFDPERGESAPFAEVLAARRGCGVPSEILAPASDG